MKATRLSDNPILMPDMADAGMIDIYGCGPNMNGPSLLVVPDWLPNALGRYYLYFAHHDGGYIGMAYADRLQGPYTVHKPGVLALCDTPFTRHIASPDVHVDPDNEELFMYYHGAGHSMACPLGQPTLRATSSDGLAFQSEANPLCAGYLRAFQWDAMTYGVTWGGGLVRSHDGKSAFEERELHFHDDLCPHSDTDPDRRNARHFALRLADAELAVYYSCIGDRPERIFCSHVKLSGDWTTWRASRPEEVLRPEYKWEGADLSLDAQGRYEPAHALRDPYVFEADGNIYLLYSIAGEQGLALAELD